MGHDNSFFATIMGHNISWVVLLLALCIFSLIILFQNLTLNYNYVFLNKLSHVVSFSLY